MKIIDLLVQELPKRGGWPDGAEYANVTGFGGEKILVDFIFPDGYCKLDYSIGIIACHLVDAGADVDYHMIRRDSYESALAASKNPVWNGEGLPPVGCECEYLNSNGEWSTVKVKYSSDQLIVISGATKILGEEQETEIAKDIIIDKPQFRPLRTEAESKRDAAVEAMQREADEGDNWIYSEYEIIYDAIAAGKIPGVKLDD